MKTTLQNSKECFFCGTTQGLEEHHIFGGARRKKSERYGLKVWLCHMHHNEPGQSVHFNADMAEYFHIIAQKKFEETHTREEFMREFGKDYIP